MSDPTGEFKTKGFMENILTGGIQRELKTDERVRLYLLNALLMIGLVMLTIFTIQNFLAEETLVAIVVGSVALTIFLVLISIRFFQNFRIASIFVPILTFALFTYLNYMGDRGGASTLWAIIYPMFAVFLTGWKLGLTLSLFFLLVQALLFFFTDGFLAPLMPPARPELPLDFQVRIMATGILSMGFALSFEIIRKKTLDNLELSRKALSQAADALLVEKASSDAIFENVQEGIFLLDDQFNFDPQYSQILEDILGWQNLGGIHFLDLLKDKITEKDLQATTDYLEMFFARKPNISLLKEINPLEVITLNLPDPDKGFKEKYLSFNFSLVEKPKKMILGTVQDRTAELELTEKLKEEEAKGARQMKNLFQIIHIKPEMMVQFLEDAQRDLESINDLLKSKENDSAYILEQIFQGIHAIKGNSQLLGLEATVDLSHKIENKIKDMQVKPFQWNYLLQLTVDLSYLQGELNDIKMLIHKIQRFQDDIGVDSPEDKDLILMALKEFTKRETADKPVDLQLVSTNYKAEHIPAEYRKAVKEVLVQLVRNSLAHGIEPGEERKSMGKPAQGTIALKTSRAAGQIKIIYSEDGRGLQGEKILKAAKANPRFKDLDFENMSPQQIMGLIFRPGFSTSEKADQTSGQGIGMAMVKNRVEGLGGTLKIKSSPGKNLSFEITLPEPLIKG